MCHTGFQSTPVASIATCVQLFSASHSDNAIKLAVGVISLGTGLGARSAGIASKIKGF
jgi:hypothetical protein